MAEGGGTATHRRTKTTLHNKTIIQSRGKEEEGCRRHPAVEGRIPRDHLRLIQLAEDLTNGVVDKAEGTLTPSLPRDEEAGQLCHRWIATCLQIQAVSENSDRTVIHIDDCQ